MRRSRPAGRPRNVTVCTPATAAPAHFVNGCIVGVVAAAQECAPWDHRSRSASVEAPRAFSARTSVDDGAAGDSQGNPREADWSRVGKVVLAPVHRMSGGQRAIAATGLEVQALNARAPRRGQDFPGAHFLGRQHTRLRGLRFADVAALSSLHQDPEVRRVLLEPAPTAFLEIAGLVIRANRVYVEQPGLGLWHASESGERFLGVLSLLPGAGAGAVELGMRLSPAQAMRDAVGDGITVLCEHAFDTLGLLTLCAHAHADDGNARHWLLAAGFRECGESLRHGPGALAFSLDRDTWHHVATRGSSAGRSPAG